MGSMYQIDKLDEGNYDSWSIQMRSVLVHAEIWRVMDGERPVAEAECTRRKGIGNDHIEREQQHRSFTVLAAADVSKLEGSSWCLDSGATAHMSCARSLFTNYVFQEENVALADNNVIRAVGRGDVILRTEFCELKLENVLHVPQIKGNFVSVSRAVEHGCTVNFNNKCAVVSQQGQPILRAVKKNKLFLIESNGDVCFSTVQCSAAMWHFRYGHLNYGSLMKLTKNMMVLGIDNVDFSDKS